MTWFNITMPIEWVNRWFRKLDHGEVCVKRGEVVMVKGGWFEVLLISKDGLMVKPCKGTKITER